MLSRQIPACKNCPYQPVDVLMNINGVKLNIFDIDLVIEVGKRIQAVAELKKYSNAASYKRIFMPAHEYVGLKKVAKCLHADSYFIVFDGFQYFVAEVDRFARRDSILHRGQRMIPFLREEFRVLSESEFRDFWMDVYV